MHADPAGRQCKSSRGANHNSLLMGFSSPWPVRLHTWLYGSPSSIPGQKEKLQQVLRDPTSSIPLQRHLTLLQSTVPSLLCYYLQVSACMHTPHASCTSSILYCCCSLSTHSPVLALFRPVETRYQPSTMKTVGWFSEHSRMVWLILD